MRPRTCLFTQTLLQAAIVNLVLCSRNALTTSKRLNFTMLATEASTEWSSHPTLLTSTKV